MVVKDYGPKAFFPLFVFLFIYLGAGIIFSIMGVERPFNQIPREAALVAGIVAALIMGKEKLDFKIDLISKHGGEPGVILMCIIFLLAGAFAGAAKGMGGVEATVNLGLSIIPRKFIFSGIFIISALIATAMGTSMGTIAAIGPIALGLAAKANILPEIAIASVVGGAMFGDNLSIISDTTIAATRGAGCNMNEKFKMNFLIALPAALLTIIIYAFIGTGEELQGVYSYEIIKIVPYIIVLISALLGMNVIAVLLLGTGMCGIIGLMTHSITLSSYAQSITAGINGMSGLIIIAIVLRGLTGLVSEYGGIKWLVNSLEKRIHSRRGAEYGISLLVALVDCSMANNTVAILVTAPLAKTFAKIHNIAPKRIASLLDIFSCAMQGILPHGGQMLLASTLTGLSPFVIVKSSYYIFLLTFFAIITIQFGLLKTKEEKLGIKIYE